MEKMDSGPPARDPGLSSGEQGLYPARYLDPINHPSDYLPSITKKKAEHQIIDAFKLWCWRRLLRVPWTARRSNQSILKKINPEYSLEGLMLNLKLQYFGISSGIQYKELTHWKGPWCWERLKAGREGDDRWWDGWMASLTQWTWVWVNSGSGWWTRKPGILWSMGSQRVRHDWATELTEPRRADGGPPTVPLPCGVVRTPHESHSKGVCCAVCAHVSKKLAKHLCSHPN